MPMTPNLAGLAFSMMSSCLEILFVQLRNQPVPPLLWRLNAPTH